MNEGEFRNYLAEYNLPEDHVRALVAALECINRHFLWKEVAEGECDSLCPLRNIIYEHVGDWKTAGKLLGRLVALVKTRYDPDGPCTGEDFLFEKHTTKSRAIFIELAAKGATREEIHQALAKRLTWEMKVALREMNGKESDGAMVHVFHFYTGIRNHSGAAGVRVIRLLVEGLVM